MPKITVKKNVKKFYRAGLLFGFFLLTNSLSQSIKNFELLSQFTKGENIPYADSWGYVAPDGHEYGLLTNHSGLSIIDLIDPRNPRELYFIETATSLWHDVKTYKNYAYVVSDVEGENKGLQIIDLSGLPDSAPGIKNIVTPSIGKIHNISFEEKRGLLFMVGTGNDGNPIGIYDVSTPDNPVHLADINTTSHDMMPSGNRLYIATSYSKSFLIYDISNPGSPQFLAEFQAGATPGYAHNIWPSADRNIAITSEETVGKTMKIWDISDLGNIRLINEWLGDSRWIMHQVYIYGDTAWAAHYGAGVWALDISNPENIVELGHHTPHNFNPEEDHYAGSWGGYFNFPSGIIIHSDNPGGLYILGPKPGNENHTRIIPSLAPIKSYSFASQIRLNLPLLEDLGIEVYNLRGQPIAFRQFKENVSDYQVLYIQADGPKAVYNLKLSEPPKK